MENKFNDILEVTVLRWKFKETGILILGSILLISVGEYSTKASTLSYVSGEIMPNMTSNISPIGVVEASSYYNNTQPTTYRAFDGIDDTNGWTANEKTGWISYLFPSPVVITKYSIMPRSEAVYGPNQSPKSFTLEGFDGASWVVVDSQKNISNWSLHQSKDFSINNNSAFLKYRINISANNGDPVAVSIGEIKFEGYSTDLIPQMETNSSPSGIVTASSYWRDTEPTTYTAFDDLTNYNGWTANEVTGWLAYDFLRPVVATGYSIEPRMETSFGYLQTPRNFTFEGFDGSSWEILDTHEDVTDWQLGVKKYFYLNNVKKSYSKYRINITSNNGDLLAVSIGEMEIFGHYLNDLIPKMKSNTVPGGVVEASSYYPTTEVTTYRAFDDLIDTNGWTANQTTGWLKYSFPFPAVITSYTLDSRTEPIYGANQSPRDFLFEGYDGTQWVTLDAQYNVTDWDEAPHKEYVLENNDAYISYRLRITSNNGDPLAVSIGEVQMFGYYL